MKISKGQEREQESRRVKGSRVGLESEAGGEQEEGRQGKQEERRVGTAICEERRGVKCKDRENESRGRREEGVTRG